MKRSVSGVILTAEGTQLLKVAQEICQLSSGIPTRVRKGSIQERTWSVGSIGFLSGQLLVPALAALPGSAAGTRFRFVDFTSNELVAYGLNGAFDLAVHIVPLQWTRAWTSRRLGSLRWGLFARRGHSLTERSPVEQSEVLRVPFVLPTGWTAQGLEMGEDHCPIPLRQRIAGHEASTAETALELVSSSDQLAYLPEIMTRRAVAEGRVSEIGVEGWPAARKDVYLTARTDVVSKHFYLTLIEALQSAMGPIVPCLLGFLICA